MKRIASLLAFVLVPLALVVGSAQELSQQKASVPAQAAQADALKLIKEVYGDEYTNAKTAYDKQALAKKLLEKGEETNDDRASKFVLLRLARDVATQAFDGPTAFRAIDDMAESFRIDAIEMKASVLVKAGTAATKPDEHKSIAEKAMELMDDAIAADNFKVAAQVGELALREARKVDAKDLMAQARNQIAKTAELASAHEGARAAELTLKTTPNDPEANLIVGKYLCFVKNDWDKGLRMLALGSDQALSALAKKDIEGAASSTEQAKLGDAWWDSAGKQVNTANKRMQARARYWYRKAFSELSGLTRDKVEKRLAAISPGVDELSLDILPRINLKRDRVAGDWQQTAAGLGCTSEAIARVMLPVVVDGEYDLAVSFVRLSGKNDICVMLPVGSHSCMVLLSGWDGKYSGLEMIDRNRADKNISKTALGKLLNGKKYNLLISVRMRRHIASIEVLCDHVSIIRWKGNESSLSLSSDWQLPESHRIGLGTHQPATFQSARLKMISGNAEWIK